jgi:hypothetical protein
MPDTLPLPREGTGSMDWWKSELQTARDLRDKLLPGWKRNLARYRGEAHENDYLSGWDIKGQIQVNVDFYATEQKKASLFFRTPDVQLSPKRPEFAAAVPLYQAVLNEYLSGSQANAMAAVDECLMDVLCPAGIAAVKVGYSAVVDGTKQVEVTPPAAPPMPEGQPQMPGTPPMPEGGMPPEMGGMMPPPMPMYEEVPNVIHDAYTIDRISPARLLIPVDFTSSDYDKALWLAFEFEIDEETAKARGWNLGPDDMTASEPPKLLVTPPSPEKQRPAIRGTEIWYRASRVDANEKHPGKLRQLVMVDGVEEPVIHQDSPAQQFNEYGKLVVGETRFPIRVLTLRYVSDSHYPPSDCTMTRVAVDEESAARTIMMEQRKRSLPLRWFDRNRMDPDDIAKVQRSEVQGLIALDGNGNELIGEVARANYPRENFEISRVNERDIEKTWAMGPNQQGVRAGSGTTATELSLMQGNIDVRMDAERTKVLNWFVSIAEALGALVQLFADDEQYVEVLGESGAKELMQWDKTKIAGQFVFSVKPDSAQRVDANVDRKMSLDLYQLTANDPYVKRPELTRTVLEKFDVNPNKAMQEPPQAPPEKPRITLSFKGEDLDNPMVVSLLQQSGYQIDPAAVQNLLAMQGGYIPTTQIASQASDPAPDTTHPGPAEMVQPINKHSLDHSIGGGR